MPESVMSEKKRNALNISIEEILFLCYYAVMEIAKGIGLVSGGTLYKMSLVIGTAFAICKIAAGTYQIREYLLMVLLILIGFIDWIGAGNQAALICIILVISMKNISSKHVLKVGAVIWGTTYVFQILSQILNLRSRDFVIHNKYHLGYLIRWGLGYTHPNVLQISYVVLIAYIFFAYNFHGRNLLKMIFFAMLFGGYIFIYSLSMTGVLFLLIFLTIVYMFDRISFLKHPGRIISLIIQSIFPVSVLMSTLGSVALKGKVFDYLNKIMTTRLALSRYFLTTYGISLFGRDFSKLSAVYTLDCSYTNLLMHGGLLLFILMFIGYFWTIRRAVQEPDSWERTVKISMLLSFAIAGISEPFLFNESYKNLTLVFIGEEMYQSFGKADLKEYGVVAHFIKKDRISVPILPFYKLVERYKEIKKKRQILIGVTAVLFAMAGMLIYISTVKLPTTIYALRSSCDTDDNSISIYLTTEEYQQLSQDDSVWILNYKDATTPMLKFSGRIVQAELFRGIISSAVWSGIIGLFLSSLWIILKKQKRICVRKLMKKTETNFSKMSMILMICYVVSIIPMLWLSMYNYPSADDFSMGVEAYRKFRDTGNIFAALGQGIYMAWYDYIHWMGYFTSTFFMSVPPSVFGETCYRAGVFIILGIFTFGMIYSMHALLVKALHIDKDLANCITMILLILTVQCMPQGLARVEAFFWYCSAANYVLMYSQGLIFLGLLISAVQDEKKGKKLYDLVMATIMGFFVGGANYMTSLSVAIICALLVLTAILCKCGKITLWKAESDAARAVKQKWFTLLSIPAVSMLIGFICSCMAPGNNNRAAGLTGMGPVKAILTSLYYTLSYAVGEWTNWAVICFLLLMVPFLWKAVQKTTLSYRYPVLAVIFTYGMVSANICPPMYAEGNIEAGRLQALFWMQYALCMTLLEGYLMGWFYRYLNKDRKAEIYMTDNHFSGASMTVIVSLAVMLLWGSALSVHVNPDFYTSTSAMQDLLNGHAQEYDRQNTARREILKDKSVTDAVLPAYTYKPDLLFFSDITTDPSDWTNEAVRRYYDKTSVVLGDEAK